MYQLWSEHATIIEAACTNYGGGMQHYGGSMYQYGGSMRASTMIQSFHLEAPTQAVCMASKARRHDRREARAVGLGGSCALLQQHLNALYVPTLAGTDKCSHTRLGIFQIHRERPVDGAWKQESRRKDGMK